ncbi:MAG: Crp/Fnr family transcriptional regulator [Burkholderiales bacterium]|nr:Crp/Fnr family transcriptional regulator [Burkholderiales bacterium]
MNITDGMNFQQEHADAWIGLRDRGVFPSQGLSRGAFFRSRATAIIPAQSQQIERTELAKRLRHFELFEGVPRTVLQMVAANAQLRTFHQGEFLWQRGDPARTIVLIGSGFVKASRRNRNGASKTYGLFGPGDSMGLYAFWAGMRYPTDAIALNEGVILITIDAGEISDLAEQYPQLSRNLNGEVTRFSEAFINKIEIISAGSIEQRIAVLLLQLVYRYGVDAQGGQARLPVFLTLVQISEIIDARFETVARALGHWKRAGWLIIDAQGWHFNCLDKLRELAHV